MTLLMYPTQDQIQYTHVLMLTVSLFSVNKYLQTHFHLHPLWNLFQENCVTSTKGSQTEEQDTCQVRGETGEDVSFESRFISFLVVLK